DQFMINDNMIVPPADEADMDKVEILRGPNIKPFPQTAPLPESITAKVLLKVGDNITTDHIMPAGAKILPLRSNIPAISQHCFTRCDPDFPARCQKEGAGIIIGGINYGQGSSREHAALAPLYLGIKAVIVKSFARIHVANLINAGILPLTFENEADYDKIAFGDEISLPDVRQKLIDGAPLELVDHTAGERIPLKSGFSKRQIAMLLAGGLLDYTREQQGK
ncbi:MAG: aconitate hydratase, partial [Acutalibacteraceae bacterium]